MTRPELDAADFSLGSVAEITSKSIPDNQWNLPPTIGIILAHNDANAISVEGFPLPARFWEDRHPADVVEALANLMRVDPVTPHPDPDVVPLGVLIAFEGYGARVPKDTAPDELAAFKAWCETHSLGDHPWGCESREVILIGFDGTLHWANHLRGSTTHEVTSYEHLDDWPSGRIVDALKAFTLALKDAVT
jgi:hypothetical protein